ncbi:MAG TPA: galactokinase family protein [Bryobacteraceae bacterium]|nr:galactokinase family protein [Bryobacteraceae bacterium]
MNLRDSPFFEAGRPIFQAQSPGRLDLMGGNADYTGGLVFQATIRETTCAAVQIRSDAAIVLINPQMLEQGWQERVEYRLADLTSDEAVRSLISPNAPWTAYVIGVFHLLRQRYPETVKSGATVYIESTVPLNKGVSSSAAVEVAVMKAAVAAYGLKLDGIALAEACQWVENVVAQSPCGIMDQAAVVLGETGYVMPLLCQPCCPYPLVRLPEELECRAIDSGIRHSIAGRACETARAAAFMAYKMICDWEQLPVTFDDSVSIPHFTDSRWNGYLSNLSPSIFRSRFENRLPESLSGAAYLEKTRVHVDPFTAVRPEVLYPIRAAARYAVEENHRVRLFVELARRPAGFESMGELMYQSHYAYTECGLGCEATDHIVDLVRSEGLYGAKMTGGGAGGTVAVLFHKASEDAFARVVERYAEYSGSTPYVFEGSSPGADRRGVETL